MIVTIDVDGVVADMAPCDFNRELRTWTNYRAKRLLASCDVVTLNRVLGNWHSYFVSARYFRGAADCTKEWLREQGVKVELALGVLCFEGIGRMYETGMCKYEYASEFKPTLLQALGSTLHIDDHPHVVQSISPQNVCLYHNPAFEANTTLYESDYCKWKAKNWLEVESIIKRRSIEQQNNCS